MPASVEQATADIDRVGRRARLGASAPLVLPENDGAAVGARLVDAEGHVRVDAVAVQGRAKGIKRAVLRVSRLFLTEQAAYNRELWHAVAELNHQVVVLRGRVAGLSSELEQLRAVEASRHATATLRMDELEDRLDDDAAVRH